MDDCVSINFSSNEKCDLNSLDHTQRPGYLIEVRVHIYVVPRSTMNTNGETEN